MHPQQPSHQIFHHLNHSYFQNLAKLQLQISKNYHQHISNSLINSYSQCISYFDNIGQPASIYFQHKLKKLIAGGQLQKQSNKKKKKVKIDIIQGMQNEPVGQKVVNEINSLQIYEYKINEIINKQKQNVMNRRKKLSKTIARSASINNKSMGSILQEQQEDSNVFQRLMQN